MLHLKEKLRNGGSGFKGIGNILQAKDKLEEPWNILKDNISLPAATLSQSILRHNQSWMNSFAERFNFKLAPHGKTTMLPDLFSLQISAGCWGMTLACVSQVAAAHKSGVKRIILANQLVGRCNMDIISTIFSNDPDFDFICLIDSPENVAQLGEFFKGRNQEIKVLLEYGPLGGRTGVRDNAQEQAVISELQKWPDTVFLKGIEFFEGILKDEKQIREFVQHCLSRLPLLSKNGVFAEDELIISGAGTSWFDVVAEEFLSFERKSGLSLTKILRSGCYLIYDIGLYKQMEARVHKMDLGKKENHENFSILAESLKPSLKIWAYVQSIPEPNLAIIGMGKRDIAIDCGYPVLHSQFRLEDGKRNQKLIDKEGDAVWTIFNMMDQHSYMRICENADIKVGDIIAFDIYHPCTTMDKWRNVLLIDDFYNVLDVYQSEF